MSLLSLGVVLEVGTTDEISRVSDDNISLGPTARGD